MLTGGYEGFDSVKSINVGVPFAAEVTVNVIGAIAAFIVGGGDDAIVLKVKVMVMMLVAVFLGVAA